MANLMRSLVLSLAVFVLAGCGGGAGHQTAAIEQRLSVVERALVNQMRINKDQEDRITVLEKEVLMRAGSGK